MELTLKIKRLEKNGIFPQLPKYETSGAAGMDIRAFIEEKITIFPSENILIPTGLCVSIPKGYVGLLFIRSSLGIKHGLSLSNNVGVIDSDYRGEIKVGLCNLSKTAYTIQKDERIAQLLIVPALMINIEEGDIGETQRSTGGFGSTGKI